jgi:hypothetical protein
MEIDVENINLDLLPTDGDRMLEEIDKGNLAIARSKADFLYMVALNGRIHMFSHTIGAPGGGQKDFERDEKSVAIVRKVTGLADACYVCEFDKGFNIYHVMATAEQAILDMFPGTDRDNDGVVDFSIPDSDE